MRARSALLTVAAVALAVTAEYTICYVNAFQTQPDEAAFWTSGHSSLLMKRANGTNLTDPDWPGEFILDTSTAVKRSSIAAVVSDRDVVARGQSAYRYEYC